MTYKPDEIDDVFLPGRPVDGGAPFEQQRADVALAQAGERRAQGAVGSGDDRCAARFQRWRCSPRADAAAVVRMMTGPASGVERSRAPGGVRSSRSKITRVSGRSRYAPREVSIGSSARIVPTPTPIASISARSRCAWRSAAAEVSRVGRPALRRHEPVLADRGLEDHERPPLTHQREERLIEHRGGVSSGPDFHPDAMRLEKGEAPTAHAWDWDRPPRRPRAGCPPRRCARHMGRCVPCGCRARASSRAFRRGRAHPPCRARAPRRALRPPGGDSRDRRPRLQPRR